MLWVIKHALLSRAIAKICMVPPYFYHVLQGARKLSQRPQDCKNMMYCGIYFKQLILTLQSSCWWLLYKKLTTVNTGKSSVNTFNANGWQPYFVYQFNYPHIWMFQIATESLPNLENEIFLSKFGKNRQVQKGCFLSKFCSTMTSTKYPNTTSSSLWVGKDFTKGN